ncbi:MAG: hypothetical protein ACE5GK_09080 [Nitrospiria bacterium]
MALFKNPFKKHRHSNPAIADLYRITEHIDGDLETAISALPNLAEAVRQGARTLLQRSLLDQIKEYDLRTGRHILENIDATMEEAMLKKLTGMMLLFCHEELSKLFRRETVPSILTTALHYEIYKALPKEEGFVAYLQYQNPHFEDPKMAPAHKFGNDIAKIVSVSDQLFYLIIAQQTSVISEVSVRLIRWVLLGEAIDPPAESR